MKYRYKGVIFDLDGTLVDTIEDIAVSVNQALKSRGYPLHNAEEYKSKVGWGVKRLALLSLPEGVQQNKEEADKLATELSGDSAAFYAENPLNFSKAYPGIVDVLSALKRLKIKTAVLTNKPDPVAQKVISGLFLPGSFEYVRGESIGGSRKPDPECVWELLLELNLKPSDVIFVGDSEIDMECANAAGCFPLGVDWGYRDKDTILAGGARSIIHKAEELMEFFPKGVLL